MLKRQEEVEEEEENEEVEEKEVPTSSQSRSSHQQQPMIQRKVLPVERDVEILVDLSQRRPDGALSKFKKGASTRRELLN